MEIFIGPDHEWMTAEAARLVTRKMELSVRANGIFTAALSGGETPKSLYRLLSSRPYRKNIDWRAVHVFMVDERFVPYAHPESNRRLIQEMLVDRVNLPIDHFHPIETRYRTLSHATIAYEKQIGAFFGLRKRSEFPRFDLVLLGIGEDGHTASLFPGSRALKEEKRIAVPVRRSGSRPARITLTLPALNNARTIIFLVSGKRKASALERVILEEDPLLPASLVRPNRGSCVFFIDKEAAEHILNAEVESRVSE